MMLTLANLSTTDKTRYQLAYANLVNLANGNDKLASVAAVDVEEAHFEDDIPF